MSEALADRWRAARPPFAGLHLDNAACSRQSIAAMDAAARHAVHESEVGGYVAAEAAAPVLDAGRAAIAALCCGPDASNLEVLFTTGSLNALDLLLGSWPAEHRTLACLPGEYGPNLAVMAAHGFTVRTLPIRDDGRLALDDAAYQLNEDPPDLVHLTPVASHSGVVQPLAMVAQLCRELGLPLVVDAAQALGQVDCAVGADVTYSSSRKWIAGPRGVGALAVRPELLERLTPRLPAPKWAQPLTVGQQLEFGEANIAARVGFSVALGEHLAYGPEAVRARLAELGAASRAALVDVPGWRWSKRARSSARSPRLRLRRRRRPAVGARVVARRAADRDHLRRGAARAPGDDGAGAADLAARWTPRRRTWRPSPKP